MHTPPVWSAAPATVQYVSSISFVLTHTASPPAHSRIVEPEFNAVKLAARPPFVHTIVATVPQHACNMAATQLTVYSRLQVLVKL